MSSQGPSEESPEAEEVARVVEIIQDSSLRQTSEDRQKLLDDLSRLLSKPNISPELYDELIRALRQSRLQAQTEQQYERPSTTQFQMPTAQQYQKHRHHNLKLHLSHHCLNIFKLSLNSFLQ